MASSYKPYIIYQNLFKFIAYRGLTTRQQLLGEREFATTLQYSFYHVIEADPATYIILVDVGASQATKSNDFSKMIEKLPNKDGVTIIVVIENEISSHFIKKIAGFVTAHPTSTLNVYGYTVFSYDLPSHHAVPKHMLMSEAEVESVRKTFMVNNENFPKIHLLDPPIVWLGAKKGQLVKIIRDSEVTLTSIAYREVI